MTNEVYENYVKKNLHIPYVQFNNIDPSIIKIIIEVLTEAFQKYPLLINSLITIGNQEYNNDLLYLAYCADKNNWLNWQFPKNNSNSFKSTLEVTYFENRSICYYLGLGLCPILEQIGYLNFEEYKKENPNGHIAIKNSFLKPAVWHEVGHMLDFFMGISNSITFQKIIKNHNIAKEISDYATIDKAELLAESFSMYILGEENPLAKKIGLLVDKEYLRYSKNILLKEKFNVQKYYRYFKKNDNIL